jgi:hypothetical protein
MPRDAREAGMKGKTYFLSFVEECVMDPAYFEYVGGRIEVYEMGADKYAIEEIRFFTKKLKEFYKLREKWDFEEVTAKELERLRKKIIVLNEKD